MLDLVDSYQRKFVYLRLSVTDRCNFKCIYCLPNGYQASPDQDPELNHDEITRLVRAFSKLGIKKVRLTGGEPTVRRDIIEIAERVNAIPGIQKLAITTNGYRLFELAKPLRDAGVRALNVSIDSLDRESFHRLSGTDRLEHILKGVDRALGLGFSDVKVNSVLMKESTEHELGRFMTWIKDKPITVRFIELMRTGKNTEFFEQRHLSGGVIQFQLLSTGWKQKPRLSDDGPATVYEHPDSVGKIGIIAPYSKDFCSTCNRLRVTSRGALRLCLFGEKDESLRPYLQRDSDAGDLTDRILELLKEKPIAHQLHEGKYGNTWNLSGIGG